MKKRLDVLIFEKQLTDSREKAKALIMAGVVFVDGQKADKAGEQYLDNVEIEVRSNPIKYVSRGGLKLEKAIELWGIDLKQKICVDIGASTGGFSDCMLQNDAKKVYAVDVGYGQLAWKIRSDERVTVLDRTNARYLSPEIISEPIEFFSVDVSFISLKLILPAIKSIVSNQGFGICLIKPQFEAGKGKVGKNGVVREKSDHIEVIQNVFTYITDNSFYVQNLSFSPIKGPEGNIEYLVLISKMECLDEVDINKIVDLAHDDLKEKTL